MMPKNKNLPNEERLSQDLEENKEDQEASEVSKEEETEETNLEKREYKDREEKRLIGEFNDLSSQLENLLSDGNEEIGAARQSFEATLEIIGQGRKFNETLETYEKFQGTISRLRETKDKLDDVFSAINDSGEIKEEYLSHLENNEFFELEDDLSALNYLTEEIDNFSYYLRSFVDQFQDMNPYLDEVPLKISTIKVSLDSLKDRCLRIKNQIGETIEDSKRLLEFKNNSAE